MWTKIGTEHFTEKEFVASETAKKYNISNSIPSNLRCNAQETLEFIEELRVAWRGAIRITSGYRGTQLNKLVGGSTTSAHCYAYAADLQPCNGKIEEFKEFVKDWIKDKVFDQCLLETDSKGTEWVHIGIKNRTGKQRCEIKLYKA